MSPEASKSPIDESKPLRPTKCLYLLDNPSSDIRFVDISTTPVFSALTDTSPTKPAPIPADLHATAKQAAESAPPTLHLAPAPSSSSSPTSVLSRTRTRLLATTPGSNRSPLAELTSSGLWSLGQWTISFPPDSAHCSHQIVLRPTGIGSRADWFVKDSVPYFWDMVHVGLRGGRTVYKLLRGVEGKRVEVARFEALRARDRYGVLWLDGSETEGVDEVVACVSLVATARRVESFRA